MSVAFLQMKIQRKDSIVIILFVVFLCQTISTVNSLEVIDPVHQVETDIFSSSSSLNSTIRGLQQLSAHHNSKVSVQCGSLSENGKAGCGPGQYSGDGCNGCTQCPTGIKHTTINPFY